MKKVALILISALTVSCLSSCYVEEREGHRYHHPFWHHREHAEVIIRGSIDNKGNDSSPMTKEIYAAKK